MDRPDESDDVVDWMDYADYLEAENGLLAAYIAVADGELFHRSVKPVYGDAIVKYITEGSVDEEEEEVE